MSAGPRNGALQPDQARRTAFEVLRAVRRGSSWEQAWARQGRRLVSGSRDRRFAVELAGGVLRLRGRLDHGLRPHVRRGLQNLSPDVLDLLRLGTYQLLEAQRVADYSAVHTTVELTKRVCPHAAALVNAVLRSLQRTPPNYPAASIDPEAHLHAYASHPEWLLRRWLARFGADETDALCAYANRRPTLCLRVHPERMSTAAVLALLPGSAPGLWSASTVRCPAGSFANARALVAQGAVTVQDESATLVVEEADPRPGQVWLDLAAAPGGKSGHLAARVGPRGLVRAYDRTETKVQRLRQTASRLGLPQLLVAQADARSLQASAADGVLVDAPCSGLGVLGRRPDARWRKRPEDLPRLAALQAELLRAAARLVRPGGVLVYSVCSFEPEETLEVSAAFGREHAEFHLEAGGAPAPLRWAPGILYFFPQRHGVDGGFVARWRREV